MIVDKKVIQKTIAALKAAETINFQIDPRAVGAMRANCTMARIYLEVALKWNQSAPIAERNRLEAQEQAAAADFISTLE
ncbi:MAG: hypothetical protein JWP44_4363 [Mucilaginibacter sp.]|nr:hypothetical protein [Mucilaginibacter sp.]